MLLGLAWLAPLVSFVAILFFGPRMGHHGKNAAWVATAAIGTSLVLSLAAFGTWLSAHPVTAVSHSTHSVNAAHAANAAHSANAAHADGHAADAHDDHGDHAEAGGHGDAGGHGEHHAARVPASYSGDWYTLYQGGNLRLTIGWYIDALTVLMFVVVSFIATCIHVYASGYMHDELHDVTDHEVHLSDGGHLHRPGRFPRFFQALSLFCFSMLGILIAGNLAMVFIFWELVGICSWFLIGFYFERKSASTAANKAFIAQWKAYTKNPKRTTNDPMEAHYIGFNMWVKAVQKAGTTDPAKVIDAMVGVTVPNLTGGYSAMMPNHHITKPVLIGEIRADGQMNTVWQTPGTVVANEWSPYLEGSKDLIADWRAPLSCGNFNVVTGKCGGASK